MNSASEEAKKIFSKINEINEEEKKKINTLLRIYNQSSSLKYISIA